MLKMLTPPPCRPLPLECTTRCCSEPEPRRQWSNQIMSLTQYLGSLRSFSFSIPSCDLSCELLPLPGCQCRSRRCTPRCWQAASSCTRRTRPGSPVEGCLGFTHEQKTLWKGNTRAFQHVSYLVLMAPLQLDHDCLASESIEEGLGVHGHGSHPEFGLALWNWSSSGL